MEKRLSVSIIKEFFSYDKTSGDVTIKKRDRKWFNSKFSYPAFNSRYGDKSMKTVDKDGYLIMTVLGVRLTAHHIAYAIVNGRYAREIDHINGIRDDNSWSNLREVTRVDNMKNKCLWNRNKTGVMGVSLIKETKRWRVRINTKTQKSKQLGMFKDYFEAVCCRKSAEITYGYHENHGRIKV